jgi:hypothetical protein
MLVKFRDKEEPFIFFQKEYDDILPIIEMVKDQVYVNIFLDEEGIERVFGRFIRYEFTIEVNTVTVSNRDTLLVFIDCDEKVLIY